MSHINGLELALMTREEKLRFFNTHDLPDFILEERNRRMAGTKKEIQNIPTAIPKKNAPIFDAGESLDKSDKISIIGIVIGTLLFIIDKLLLVYGSGTGK